MTAIHHLYGTDGQCMASVLYDRKEYHVQFEVNFESWYPDARVQFVPLDVDTTRILQGIRQMICTPGLGATELAVYKEAYITRVLRFVKQ